MYSRGWQATGITIIPLGYLVTKKNKKNFFSSKKGAMGTPG